DEPRRARADEDRDDDPAAAEQVLGEVAQGERETCEVDAGRRLQAEADVDQTVVLDRPVRGEDRRDVAGEADGADAGADGHRGMMPDACPPTRHRRGLDTRWCSSTCSATSGPTRRPRRRPTSPSE